jgi:riboflavin kinase/FMN adenylyltransferase
MKVYYKPEHIEKKKNTIITIGTFDGVHLGHQKILDEVVQRAKETNSRSLVITFHPHPRFVVSPDYNLELLTTTDEKLTILETTEIDNVLVVNFTEEFSRLSYETFIKNIICDEIGVKHIVIGYDHKFGKNRSGDKNKLIELSGICNYTVSSVDEVELEGEVISSTKIRNALKFGELDKANNFLGRNYFFSGKVIRGAQRGRELGYPTANVMPEDHKLIPANGVYFVRVYIRDEEYFGLMNIGTRPTFEHLNKPIIETYIFGMNKNIYSKLIKTEVIKKIRNEVKFVTKNALITQIRKDIETAEQLIDELS